MRNLRLLVLLVACVGTAVGCSREPRHVRLATTTSVQDSGLLDALIPVYEKASGDKVDVVAVGTGAAFKLAKDGNADLLLVHDQKGEEAFIAAGDGKERRPFCWNTFEILGPASDPAGVKGSRTADEALRRIAGAGAGFVSRGDDSGTNRRELSLWKTAGGLTKWPGYREAAGGMGAALLVADEKNAYVLCDRATALAYRSKLRLAPLLADTAELRNTYSVVVLDERRHPEIAGAQARKLADWLVGAEAGRIVADFRVAGETLFHVIRSGE